MKKYIATIGAVAIVGVMILYLIVDDNDVEIEPLQTMYDAKLPEASIVDKRDVTINYQDASSNEKEKQKLDLIHKKQKNDHLEAVAFTADGAYKIALYNPSDTLVRKEGKSVVYIKGTYGRETFNLKVPKQLITEKRGEGIVLQITDTKSGEVYQTPANFLADITDTSRRNFISIDPDDIDNIMYESKGAILPLPGVPQE